MKRLNVMTMLNVYSLFLQTDIIAVVKNCFFISMIDCAEFFYQWRIHFSDRYKLTMINHRDQEFFNVAVMNYRNFFSYVQRQIDRVLRSCRAFARVYIDDVIIFFKIKENHLFHLKKMFQIFRKFNIFIKSFKTFLIYFSVRFLSQKMNSLNLIIDENKFRVINNLKFPVTLRQLKHYFDLTDWMREYVEKYVKIAELLQIRKTTMLKKSFFIDEFVRRTFFSKFRLKNPTSTKKNFFRTFQKILFSSRYFVHFNFIRQFYMNVDVSKKKKMKVMIYHSKQQTNNYSARIMIEPIMFFNRRITDIESKYWSIELKLADLVWIFRKIRHMIESAQLFSIIYTNHGVAVEISRQKSFFISFIDKFNFRLVRIFEYIQRFNLIIKHKSEKKHIIPNALFRLKSFDSNLNFKKKKLNVLMTFNHFFIQNQAFNLSFTIEIFKKFRNQIIQNYQKKSIWIKIRDVIAKTQKDDTKIDFHEKKDLLYAEKNHILKHAHQSRRLCLSNFVLKSIFRTVHGDFHFEFHKCYEMLSSAYYIRNFITNLKIYLKHCPECQINQTRRHKSYKILQFIETSPISFHTIAMNFILFFFETKQFNCVMSVTCKFFKKMTLISKRIEWIAKKWVKIFFTRLNIMNWKLFKQIISDRNRKFLNEFWIILFFKFEIRLLYNTAYHFQIDGLFERTNQFVEIALRYHLITLNNLTAWSEILSAVQKNFNNSVSFTNRMSNECVYDFIFIISADLFKINFEASFFSIWIRQKIVDAIAFAQMIFKFHYDRKHKTINFFEKKLNFVSFSLWLQHFFHKKIEQEAVSTIRRIFQNVSASRKSRLQIRNFFSLTHSFCFHHSSTEISFRFKIRFIRSSTISIFVDSCWRKHKQNQKLRRSKNCSV